MPRTRVVQLPRARQTSGRRASSRERRRSPRGHAERHLAADHDRRRVRLPIASRAREIGALRSRSASGSSPRPRRPIPGSARRTVRRSSICGSRPRADARSRGAPRGAPTARIRIVPRPRRASRAAPIAIAASTTAARPGRSARRRGTLAAARPSTRRGRLRIGHRASPRCPIAATSRCSGRCMNRMECADQRAARVSPGRPRALRPPWPSIGRRRGPSRSHLTPSGGGGRVRASREGGDRAAAALAPARCLQRRFATLRAPAPLRPGRRSSPRHSAASLAVCSWALLATRRDLAESSTLTCSARDRIKW